MFSKKAFDQIGGFDETLPVLGDWDFNIRFLEKFEIGLIRENLANYHTFYGNANLINTEIEKYLSVTREDILNVAKKYYNKENRVTLYYLPKEKN